MLSYNSHLCIVTVFFWISCLIGNHLVIEEGLVALTFFGLLLVIFMYLCIKSSIGTQSEVS